MTIVYALTAMEGSLYAAQCLISVYSLRFYGNDNPVVILTDDKSAPRLKGFNKYNVEVKVIPFDDEVSATYRSRLIKTSIPHYVRPPFLYVDCDTVICDKLGEPCCTIGGVLDGHTTLNNHIHKKYFLARDRRLGFSATKSFGYNCNGGVLYFRDDTCVKVFDKWLELWKYSAYKKRDAHDQSALNEALLETNAPLTLLGGEWNCQLSHGGLQFLEHAKIIHYYSSEFGGKNYAPYYKLADPALQSAINGEVTSEVKDLVKSAKFCFNECHLISEKRVVDILQSPLLFTLSDINQKFPTLYNLLETVTGALRSLIKKVIRR